MSSSLRDRPGAKERRVRLRAAGRHDACLAGEIASVAGVSTATVYKLTRMLVDELDLPIDAVNGRWRRVD